MKKSEKFVPGSKKKSTALQKQDLRANQGLAENQRFAGEELHFLGVTERKNNDILKVGNTEAPGKGGQTKMKILIAEDERSLARVISRMLEKSGYETLIAPDGEAALEEARRTVFDAAVMDIMMPKMDGITALKRMRGEGINMPVLILSAKSEIDDKVTGLDSGANDYLTKPFSGEELLARIRAMTRKLEEPDRKLKCGNVILNRANYELSSDESSFRLTNKEFLMMEMFMSNPHQLISTERLMEKVWGYDTDAEIGVVWVYISYLRKKLSALKATVEIKARRNAGYSLEDKA